MAAAISKNAPVWVTGAGGLIGHHLVQSSPRWAPDCCVHGLRREEVDLTDTDRVREIFRREKPEMIIHCAAMSKSPLCDANRELAWAVNVEATRQLVDLASEIPFVFFSTDLVFDGIQGAYKETDVPNPLMYYGETKMRAEEFVRQHSRHVILRISLTGGHSPTGDRGFNEEMKKAWGSGKILNLFTDEYRCPLAAEVTARAVWELALSGKTGTFHLCSPEKLSRYEIGQLVAERHPELNPQIQAGSRRDYHGPPRPADTSLDIAKIQQILSFPIPRWSDWLRADVSGF